nr:reverse transcriptase domain-containing protein [Tanacetum cinerariifolium]
MHTRASNSELVEPLPEPEGTLNRRLRRRNKRVPFDQRNNPPQHPGIMYPPILDINYFHHFLVTLQNLYPMDDEPMWAADRVVALTPGSAITIPKTANKLVIKEAKTWLDELKEETIKMCDELQTTFISQFFPPALFDQILREIRAFFQHENKNITDAWLRMKEMLRNCHGHNLSKGNIIKIFYHGLNEITHEVLNALAGAIFLYKIPNQAYQLLEDKVLLKLDWAKNQKTKSPIKKTVAFAAEVQRTPISYKTTNTNLDEDDMPMSREEEAKFMQTFANLGASINLMTYSLYAKLSLETLKAAKMSKQLNLRVRTERMIFNIDSAIKHSYSNDDTCFSIDVIDEILEEDFDAILDEGSRILYSIEGTILEKEIFSEFDKFIAMVSNENCDPESDKEEPKFKKSPSTQIIKSRHILKNLI